MGLDGRDAEKEDPLFAQDTSVPGQFAQHWELRMIAQEAALKEAKDCKLLRLLAYYKTFNCAGVKIGGSVRFFETPSRRSQPKWRWPACILGIDETRVAVQK